jgi:WD40 repeat protein
MHRARVWLVLAVLTLLLPAAAFGQDMPAKPKLDLAGDELPAGAIARCGTIRYRHGGPISCVAYSPDGKSLASIGDDGVRLFNAADGKLVQFWPGRHGLEGRVEFAPSGRTLFASDWSNLRELDIATGKEVRKLTDGSVFVNSFVLSPDSKMVAIASINEVLLIEVNSWQTVRKFTGNKGHVKSVAFSPDGQTLAGGGEDHSLRFWEVATGKEKKNFDIGGEIQSIVYSPDGSKIAIAKGFFPLEGGILLLDSASGQKKREFTPWPGLMNSAIAFSRDGKSVLVSGINSKIRFFNVDDGFAHREIDAETDSILSVQFSPDSKSVACVGFDSVVHIWDAATGKSREPVKSHRRPVHCAAFSRDGKTLFTGSADRTIRAWDAANGAHLRVVAETEWNIHSLSATATNSLLAICEDLMTIDVRMGKQEGRLDARRPNPFDNGAFSANGKFAASAHLGNRGFEVYETAPVKLLRQFKTQPKNAGEVPPIAISPDGKWLATSTREQSAANSVYVVGIWDVATGKRIHEVARETKKVYALEFAPTGQELVSAGQSGRIKFYNPMTGAPFLEWTVPSDGPITALAMSADGRTIAAGESGGTVRTWERLTGQIRRTLPGHLGEVDVLRFSPDGRLLVSGSADSTALVWRLSTDESEKAPAPNADALWTDLCSGDAAVAERAIWRLASADAATLAALAAKLPRPPPTDAERMKSLIADLNSDKFATRQHAETELAKLGPIAQPALKSALDGKPSSEQRDRITALLARLDAIPTGETLGALRAVEALEHNGSAAARRRLATLAAGSAGPRVAANAKESLERMGAGK